MIVDTNIFLLSDVLGNRNRALIVFVNYNRIVRIDHHLRSMPPLERIMTAQHIQLLRELWRRFIAVLI